MHALTDQRELCTRAGVLVRHDGSEVPTINIMPTQAGVSQRIRELSCSEQCADILMVTVYVLTFINKQLLMFSFCST